MHLYSLCQTWLNLKTHTVSEKGKGGGGRFWILPNLTPLLVHSGLGYACALVQRPPVPLIHRVGYWYYAQPRRMPHRGFGASQGVLSVGSHRMQPPYVTPAVTAAHKERVERPGGSSIEAARTRGVTQKCPVVWHGAICPWCYPEPRPLTNQCVHPEAPTGIVT